MTTGKTIALTIWTLVDKVMSLLFNMLFRLVIAFLPSSMRLLISWLESPSEVTLEPKNKISHCCPFIPIYLPWSDGTRCHDLFFFLMLSFKPTFSLSSFTLTKTLFSSSFSAFWAVSPAAAMSLDSTKKGCGSSAFPPRPYLIVHVSSFGWSSFESFIIKLIIRASLVAQMVKASAYNAGDLGFHPWVGKIPWRRKWHPTPVL